MKIRYWAVASVLLGLSVGAQALECEVKYKAKRIVSETVLFQKVRNPEYKSGTAQGSGSTKASCERDALSSLKRANWEITYSSVKVK